ncbi:MAG: ABC transporter ATP-binding protein [Polyangiales bacterium]
MSESRHGARVSLREMSKQFGDRKVLRGLTLDIAPGELVTIVGRSGSGKSTLLRILCGLDAPTGGALEIADPSGGALVDAVRVVFQEPRLLPWRSVIANVNLGLPKSALANARQVLAQVGLSDRESDYPSVLSGGQRQRVALARALVHAPKMLLLDEPFGALDALTRIEAQRLVEQLWRRAGFTVVLVTHDVEEAVLLGDRVLVVEDGEIVESVEVDLPRPRSREMPEIGRLTTHLLDRVMGKASPSWPAPGESGELPRAIDAAPDNPDARPKLVAHAR